MAEHDSTARPRKPDPAPDRPVASGSEAQLIRSERSAAAKLSNVIRLADFMALLMVMATLFSAYATWRTAQVTERVFAVTDRPFLGVRSVAFQQTDSTTPTITVAFVNFGQIPALDVMVGVDALLDGKPLVQPNTTISSAEVGIASPTVMHDFDYFVTPASYHAVLSGKARLQVRVRLEYKGAERHGAYCYFERADYDYRTAEFRMDGGSDKCRSDVF